MRALLQLLLADVVASYCAVAQHQVPAASSIRSKTKYAPSGRIGYTLCCAPLDEDASGQWRVDRARLNAAWSQSVRQRRPRFLPFIAARQWARAMYFTDEADWREWIDSGEKRNPYVPRFPDEVYANSGWSSWDDFLNGPVEPGSVVFEKGYKRGKWLKGPLSEADGDEAIGR